jgi:hypothetical protein
MKAVALSAILIGFAFISGSASADSIAVQNASFETIAPVGLPYSCGTGCAYNVGPIPGWSYTGGVSGSFQPGSTLTGEPDGGSTIAYTNGGTISQDLGVDLAPDTTYLLSVWVGDRTDAPSTYTISLDAGTDAVCTTSGSSTALNPGGFADVTCTYTTGNSPLTGDLMILLGAGSGQGDFDDVSLTTVPAPEPSSIALESLGLLALAFFGVLYKRKAGVNAQ